MGLKTKETPNEERNSFKGKVLTILSLVSKKKLLEVVVVFALGLVWFPLGEMVFKQRVWTHNRTEFVKIGK